MPPVEIQTSPKVSQICWLRAELVEAISTGWLRPWVRTADVERVIEKLIVVQVQVPIDLHRQQPANPGCVHLHQSGQSDDCGRQ